MTSSNKNPEFERRRANTKISGVSPFQLFDKNVSNLKASSNIAPPIRKDTSDSPQQYSNLPPPALSLQQLLDADSHILESAPLQQQKEENGDAEQAKKRGL